MTYTSAVGWKQVWLYDENRRIREEFRDGTFPFRRMFIYDARSRLERVVLHDEHGKRLEESYSYYGDGTRLQVSYPRMPVAETGMFEASMLHMSADAVRITTLQDDRGNALEKILYNADHRPIHRVLFRYDDAGQLLEEGEAYAENEIREDFRNRYRYDAEGRCIEREMRCPFGGSRETLTYNDYGDPMEVQTISLPTDLDMFQQQPWAEHISYEYDSYRNWIRRSTETRVLDSREITHRDEQHRNLEYWYSP